MVEQSKICDFLETLSSKQPVPGGGGASALGGAVGTALGEMVSNLTIGKKKYADVEEEILEIRCKLEGYRKDFMELADEDERVFAPLAASYGMPSGTEDERAKKAEVMEKNLLEASLVPVKMMEKTLEVLDFMEILAVKGSKIAISDVGVGVQFLRTALTGAVMNVLINTKSMKDRERAEELNGYARDMIEKGTQKADAVYDIVLKAIS